MRLRVRSAFSLLYILSIIFNGRTSSQGQMADSKFLNVGEELLRETLPLQMGLRLYQLQGLKPYTWYEVKISYPTSIPASFSLQLKRGKSNSVLNHYRRLLNTEKLMFRTESLESLSNEEGIYVLVTVEPEGIVAVPHVQERQFIIFNIVCDELLLGIPHKAWWVVVLVLLCLGLAFIIPSFLPSYLLQESQSPRIKQDFSKVS
ncbi:hypothetical protein F2P56_025926 [Juglans regia]|uniref:Uncharacterized protein LOC109009461 n=2 Tax=Juglans regia TaxID=51240 RepID=A0A2I4GNI7_JUGRE|nr:uncharacterized protein LOC109009461 [Juglans regia]XP_018845465.1 uncharacterized protein LOC109009461 [Juglans regia]XP_018845466.1 uncharacterized protein LOC109009461 [Juglans regia]XP_018845467.1 uncharacterized protein LOC109009461 [Juglans regia]XP_018845468.1 uncharacterized protein LOC109009461 [Juglans regia]XP_018845469.1 uncharacterized protein LOC109009461 [Juglans regia]KAF5456441.1 hypothetical protein F2P56_025926 [Juglans regia]